MNYTITDNQELARAELWRADYNTVNCSDTNKSGCNWTKVATKNHSGASASDSFARTPAAGVFWYGMLAVDAAGNWAPAGARGPDKVTVSGSACSVSPGPDEYCCDCGPCARDEGDCDLDTECSGSLICSHTTSTDYCCNAGEAWNGGCTTSGSGPILIDPPPDSPAEADATVTIDYNQLRQTIDGIGGNYVPGNVASDPVAESNLNSLKPPHVRVFFPLLLYEPVNDDSDSNNFNWSKFKETSTVHKSFLFWQKLYQRGIPIQGCTWKFPKWMLSDDPQLHIPEANWDEAIELIAAYMITARDTYGIEFDYLSFNEPLNSGWDVYFSSSDYVKFIKKASARLQSLGLQYKWLGADSTWMNKFVNYVRPMLEDQEGRELIGAVAYHSWNTWDTAYFQDIYNLAKEYNLPVWCTEAGTNARRPTVSELESWNFAYNNARMYYNIIWHSRASVVHYWTYDSFWPLTDTNKNPYPIYYIIKQHADYLTPGTKISDVDSTDILLQAIPSIKFSNNTFAVQILNTGGNKNVFIRGLPDKATAFMLRTSATEQMAIVDSFRIEKGAVLINIKNKSLNTLYGNY